MLVDRKAVLEIAYSSDAAGVIIDHLLGSGSDRMALAVSPVVPTKRLSRYYVPIKRFHQYVVPGRRSPTTCGIQQIPTVLDCRNVRSTVSYPLSSQRNQ